MRTFEIWAEGYCVTGQSSGATLLGYGVGETFKDAVKALAEKTKDPYFDVEYISYWGCKLFDNETDARKNFG